jgi:hypothetical protein
MSSKRYLIHLFIFFVSLITFFSFPKNSYAQIRSSDFDCDTGFIPLFPKDTNPSFFYKKIVLSYPRPIVAQIIKINLYDRNIDMVVTPRNNLGMTTTDFLNQFGADVAINGEGFVPVYDPVGFSASQGDIYSNEPIGGETMFITEKNDLPNTPFVEFRGSQPAKVWDAISGFNDLIIDGNFNTNLTMCMQNSCSLDYCDASYCTIRARTSIGVTQNTGTEQWFFIINVDEAPTGVSNGVYLGELAQMMRSCNAYTAINMDGGGSTTLAASTENVVNPTGNLINHPSDGNQRVVANHLGICKGKCLEPGPYVPIPTLPSGNPRPRYQIGNEYPFPCNKIAPEDSVFFYKDQEFHSLRPYQASPCNPNKEELALFCGNDLFLGNTVNVTKNLKPPISYFSGGREIIPNPPFKPIPDACHYCDQGNCIANSPPCIPDADQCSSDDDCKQCHNNNNGTETCSFTVSFNKNFAVDVSGAELPIMGYTEPSVGKENSGNPKVTNSINPTLDETLSNNDKVNEYVSWYLNGVVNRAEYPQINANNDCIGENTKRAGRCLGVNPINGSCQDYNPFLIPPTFENPLLTVDGKSQCLETNKYCCVTIDPSAPSVDILDRDKLINYSGPIKKLLPFSLQNQERINQVTKAVESSQNVQPIRHAQTVACTYEHTFTIPIIGVPITIGGFPVECYGSWLSSLLKNNKHLTTWQDKLPPIEENYLGQDYHQYLIAYETWRGNACFTFISFNLPVIGHREMFFCFNNPLSPDWISTLFPYVSPSSTEDRLGEVTVKSAAVNFSSPNFRVINSKVSNLLPANLYFPHMEESTDLADILQKTFVPENVDRNKITDNGYIPQSNYCDIRNVRTNPGDDLFAGEISGNVNYTAQIMCNFYIWGNGNDPNYPSPWGNLCNNMISGGTCNLDPGRSVYYPTCYGQYDCEANSLCCAGTSIKLGDSGHCLPQMGYPDTHCVPKNYICNSGDNCKLFLMPGLSMCEPRDYFQCVEDALNWYRPITTPPETQSCSNMSWINMRLETKTPLADKVWTKLVAGTASVFRRIFPKVESGSAVEEIWDLPASTKVSYTSSDAEQVRAGNPASGRSGTSAELYFPHIGGVKEYFLTGIQTILRPSGFGRQLLTCNGYSDCGTSTTNPPKNNSDICSEKCSLDALLGKSLNDFLDDTTLRNKFTDLANNWFLNKCSAYQPRLDKYNQVITDSYNAGVNPIFTLAIWLHETAASDYQCICEDLGGLDPTSLYCHSAQDFGYNLSQYETTYHLSGNTVVVDTDHFSEQLVGFLSLPKWYLTRCPIDNFNCAWESYGAQYLAGNCFATSDSNRYIAAIREIYGWLTSSYEWSCYPSTVTTP